MQNTMLDSTISNSLQLFADKGFKIRVIMRCAEPWFVAKDVATCIEHSDTSAMCKLCRDKDKVVVNYAELKHSDDLSECFFGKQSPNLTLISESGLYRILAKCNLPKCEPLASGMKTPLRNQGAFLFCRFYGAVFETLFHLCYKSHLSRGARGRKTSKLQKSCTTPLTL